MKNSKYILIGAGAGFVLGMVFGWNKIISAIAGAVVGSVAGKSFNIPISAGGSGAFANEQTEQNTQMSPQ